MDEKLLTQLYRMYSRELLLYLISLCHDAPLAEDLLQETFLKAILSLNAAHTNMRAWLYTVARNLCFNAVKKRDREAQGRMLDHEYNLNSPLDQLLDEERDHALYMALNQLEHRKREVLVLQYFGGLNQKEIAHVLGITAENVRMIAHRGRRELKKILEKEGCYDLS